MVHKGSGTFNVHGFVENKPVAFTVDTDNVQLSVHYNVNAIVQKCLNIVSHLPPQSSCFTIWAALKCYNNFIYIYAWVCFNLATKCSLQRLL